jgi:hypothetical protein
MDSKNTRVQRVPLILTYFHLRMYAVAHRPIHANRQSHTSFGTPDSRSPLLLQRRTWNARCGSAHMDGAVVITLGEKAVVAIYGRKFN